MNKFASYRMSHAQFGAAVKSINTRGKKLQADIHAACVAAMLFSLHQDLGGDLNATPALQLAQNLPAGLPRNKIINWFATFTNVRITVSNGGKTWAVKNLGPKDDNFKALSEADIQAAINCPYWDNEPEPDVSLLDLDDKLKKLLKLATKAVADGKVKNPERAKQQIEALRKLAPADK